MNVLYVQEACNPCKKARQLLYEYGVDYSIIDIKNARRPEWVVITPTLYTNDGEILEGSEEIFEWLTEE